jgi:hypothetical protein
VASVSSNEMFMKRNAAGCDRKSIQSNTLLQLCVTLHSINVTVGCAIGAVGSIAVCPKSTTELLHTKAAHQVRLAGEASEVVLAMAAAVFAGRTHVPSFADGLAEAKYNSMATWKLRRSGSLDSGGAAEATGEKSDTVLKKFEAAIASWTSSKALLPLAKYDPFHAAPDPRAQQFHRDMAEALAQTLRIQTTILLLDGLVRSDSEFRFDKDELASMVEVGRLIRQMLHVPIALDNSNDAAAGLFGKLEETRKNIRRLLVECSLAATDPVYDDGVKELQSSLLSNHCFRGTSGRGNDDLAQGMLPFPSSQSPTPPAFVFLHRHLFVPNVGLSSAAANRNSLFFLQLVEHLVIRSLDFYTAWKHMEMHHMEVDAQSV